MMCPRIGSSTVTPSLTPPVEPGSAMAKVVPRVPATVRESGAVGTLADAA